MTKKTGLLDKYIIIFILIINMLHSNFLKYLVCLSIFLIFSSNSETALSEDTKPGEIPTRYGLAAVLGKTFDPVTDINFLQLSGFIMWDYDRVWHHWAPDPLRFKVECTAGMTTSPKNRAMVSVDMMALYYLDFFSSPRFKPFIEGGIGVIFTDFQVEDKEGSQGSRFNFNPQIGIGTDFKVGSGSTFFTTFRLQHMSNAGLNSDNRGINSIVLMIGRYF